MQLLAGEIDSSSVIFLGLCVATAFFKSQSQVTVMMVTVESSRTSSATKPWWKLRYAWDHCHCPVVGRSTNAQGLASSLTA